MWPVVNRSQEDLLTKGQPSLAKVVIFTEASTLQSANYELTNG